MKYLVTYDISNNKKRNTLGDILETYGYRVNYSVFEIELSKTKLNKLLKQIDEKNLYDKDQDSLRFYHLCENCISKSFELLNREDVFEEREFFI